MIRTSRDEFFIEPLARWRAGGEEEEDEGGRQHIIYRSSAVIKTPRAANQTADDVLRGETTQTNSLETMTSS